ncbi:MAG: extracellular solute-binding protein [Legionellaceae bacterium]|nr:extracellular solute-binding protein [Legionellaceae bacterium]
MSTLGLLLLSFSLWSKAIPIAFWHSFAGQLGEELHQQIQLFNQTQNEVQIVAQYKGDYIEALSSYAAAKHAGKAPAMVQVFEVGSALMQKTPGLIEPVGSLMADLAYPDLTAALLPAVASFYTQEKVLQAFPLNISLPIMYYNQDALQELGVTEQNFPKTWAEFETLLLTLQEAGYACAYTTAYPAWIHVEVYAAMHDLSFADPAVGKDYRITQQPALLAHWQRLLRWQRQGLFAYGGRNSDATVLFTSGRCALFSQSSGSLGSLRTMVPFKVGVAALPYDRQWTKGPAQASFGGAAIWVTAHQPLNVRQGIARFLQFLAAPQQQYRWYKRTGYLPMGDRAFYQKMLQSEKDPAFLQLAWNALHKARPTIALLPQNQIRTVLEQSLEAVFSHQLSVQDALAKAEQSIRYRLRRFAQNIAEQRQSQRV